MYRFSCDVRLIPSQIVTLFPDETRHLTRVLRLGVGAEVELVSGHGELARGVVLHVRGKQCQVRVDSVTEAAFPSKITICFGIPKAQALDFLIRRLTEVEVGAFQPLLSAHSLHPESWNSKRWLRVISEVGKQSQEIRFPKMGSPVELPHFLSDREKSRGLVVCDEKNRRARPTLSAARDGYDLMIGPEGGWSEEELNLFSKNDAVPLGLGENRLRCETAALVATVLLKRAIGEL